MPLCFVVTSDDSAAALGSGDVPVLATPRLIAWLEAATVNACVDLPDGATTVGTRVDVEHLLATPAGAAVTTFAEVVERAARTLVFEVTAYHDIGAGPVLIARGQVTRAIVDRDRFLSKAVPRLVIREAVPSEWDAIGELCVTAYTQGAGFPRGTDGYVHTLRDVPARSGQAEILVACAGDSLVGTVTVIPAGQPLAEVAQPGEVEFRFMAVAPEAWGQGVGRALLGAVLARAGDRPLACCVIEGNDPAAALYASCGFGRVPERARGPSPGVLLRAFIRPT